MRDSNAGGGAYDYGRTRAGGVFALAGLAASGAFALLWGAWSTIDTATEQERIAEPPDLKHVVETIEGTAQGAASQLKREGRAEAKPDG